MSRNTIDAALLKKMFLAGAKNLESKKEWINELNVFPVPDGDTGTNMTLTVMSAARDVSAIETPTMEDLCKAISSGSLKGARGNSGVILSQLLRGFTRGIKDHSELDTEILSDAFKRAVETAYKAVMKPKEGTILTVARGAAEKAEELLDESDLTLEDFIERVIEEADDVLTRTPDMLPVLKQAGVVDSGGQGLLEFLKGARKGDGSRGHRDGFRRFTSEDHNRNGRGDPVRLLHGVYHCAEPAPEGRGGAGIQEFSGEHRRLDRRGGG